MCSAGNQRKNMRRIKVMSDLVKTGKEIGEIDYLWCMRQNNKQKRQIPPAV